MIPVAQKQRKEMNGSCVGRACYIDELAVEKSRWTTYYLVLYINLPPTIKTSHKSMEAN